MRQSWDTGRTEAFSDGVFAIAITLLVLDISIPESGFDDLWSAIVHEWPAYFAYATSFLTIGFIWLGHHAMFSRLASVNRRVMQVNLLLLMAVAFLPFPTRLVAEAIRDTDAERAAVIFYGLALLLVSTLMGAMWAAVVRNPELLRPDVSEHEARAVLRAVTPNIGFYAFSTLVAVLAPQVAALGYFAIAVAGVLFARGDSHPERAHARRGPG